MQQAWAGITYLRVEDESDNGGGEGDVRVGAWGRFYLVEHVPARVCKETGEQYSAPETVERIQALIKGKKEPDKVIETPVYEYT